MALTADPPPPQGFEDCLLLDDLLTKHDMRLDRVLPEYTELRNPDAEAICDLAMYNYIEVRGGEVGIGRVRAL